jgi:hypothetical protein
VEVCGPIAPAIEVHATDASERENPSLDVGDDARGSAFVAAFRRETGITPAKYFRESEL